MELYKLPKIHTNHNKLKSRWYISYQYKHPDTKQFVRFKVWLSSKHKTIETRLKAIIQLQDYYSQKLKQGFSPFQQVDVKYTSVCEAMQYIIDVKKQINRSRTNQTTQRIYDVFALWLKKKVVIVVLTPNSLILYWHRAFLII